MAQNFLECLLEKGFKGIVEGKDKQNLPFY
jgi:hypothetical protein